MKLFSTVKHGQILAMKHDGILSITWKRPDEQMVVNTLIFDKSIDLQTAFDEIDRDSAEALASNVKFLDENEKGTIQ